MNVAAWSAHGCRLGYQSRKQEGPDLTVTRPAEAPSYSVVIPAYQAADTLPACLDALARAEPTPAEVIVYDDGSRDETAAIARVRGARVIGGGANKGPSYGRNAGVRAAGEAVVVFVDADVAVAPDAPGRLARAVADGKGVSAAFGAYADAPSPIVRNLAGRYANLRHHHVHAEAAGADGVAEAQTFWSGLGAVDRAAFLAVGGFDEDYAQPCIEDVELGLRLRANGGRVLLVGDARGDHMKDWTLRQLWRTDVFQRAVPWSQLAVRGRIAATLNTGRTEQVKSVLAQLVWLLALVGLVAGAWSGAAAGVLIAGSIGAAVAYLWANRRFLQLLARHSARTAAGGAVLHWLYHCYASATYALVMVGTGLLTRMGRRERNASQAAAFVRS